MGQDAAFNAVQHMIRTNSQTDELEQCDCCDYFTVPKGSEYEICPICFWEQDALGTSAPDQASGANHGLTLRDARRNFIALGACSGRFTLNVIPINQRRDYRHAPRAVQA